MMPEFLEAASKKMMFLIFSNGVTFGFSFTVDGTFCWGTGHSELLATSFVVTDIELKIITTWEWEQNNPRSSTSRCRLCLSRKIEFSHTEAKWKKCDTKFGSVRTWSNRKTEETLCSSFQKICTIFFWLFEGLLVSHTLHLAALIHGSSAYGRQSLVIRPVFH